MLHGHRTSRMVSGVSGGPPTPTGAPRASSPSWKARSSLVFLAPGWWQGCGHPWMKLPKENGEGAITPHQILSMGCGKEPPPGPEPRLPTGAGGGAAKRAHPLWCPGTARQRGPRRVLWAGTSPCTVSSAGSSLRPGGRGRTGEHRRPGCPRGRLWGPKEGQALGSADLHSPA